MSDDERMNYTRRRDEFYENKVTQKFQALINDNGIINFDINAIEQAIVQDRNRQNQTPIGETLADNPALALIALNKDKKPCEEYTLQLKFLHDNHLEYVYSPDKTEFIRDQNMVNLYEEHINFAENFMGVRFTP